MLPTGEHSPGEAFLNWQHFSQTTEVFPVGMIINGATTTDLSPEVIAGYDAPFPDDTFLAGARIFPSLVPTSLDDPESGPNLEAWTVPEQLDKPWLNAFSDQDPVTAGGDKVFAARVPGTAGQPHVTIEGGGHFLQEDRGPELAAVVLDFIAQTS